MQIKQEAVFVVLVVAAVAAWVVDARTINRNNMGNDDNDDDDDVADFFDDDFVVERQVQNQRRHSVTVHHFAKYTLCLRHKMRRDFYRALKEYYCMSETFAANLVVSLCTSKGDVLDKFVSDMLDMDSDGYINEYEKILLWYGK